MSASETLARCQRLREALLGAMVQRESAVKHVLRRLPPTAGIMSLHRSDGTVLFEVPPPAVASWETAVDALGPPQLILLDAGFRLLSETEDELDDITAGLEGRVAVRNQLLQSLDRRVNRFVARQERKASGTDVDDDPTARSLDTIVLVRHRRMVARARANGTNPVSLEQVYRSMLMAQDESRFRELPDLDLQLQAEADDVERALRTFTWVLQGRLSPSDEEGWGSQHVDNVARNPWEMRLDRVARSVRVLRLASADMHNGVSATANHLRTLGQAASNAECAATLTRLGQNWHRLTADFETALEEDDDNDNNNGAGGEDVMRLARERVRLEQVVEPLLHRFEDCIQFEMAEDPTASSGYDDEHEYEYEEAAWQQFYRMGRRSRAELAALQEAHAKALFELSVGKDDANRYVVRTVHSNRAKPLAKPHVHTHSRHPLSHALFCTAHLPVCALACLRRLLHLCVSWSSISHPS